ncbi:MAG: hypothetical protein RR626_01300, partial [Anaerovoracaceae bacterium]
LRKFKNRIIGCGVMVAVAFGLISIPIWGIEGKLLLGILFGTIVAIVNFNIMTISTKLMVERQQKLIYLLSMAARFFLYGITFYLTIINSGMMAIGTGAGFFTVQIAMFLIHGIGPMIVANKSKARRNVK